MFKYISESVKNLQHFEICGKIVSVSGNYVIAGGLQDFVVLGSRCEIKNKSKKCVTAEVVASDNSGVKLVVFTSTEDIGVGCSVRLLGRHADIKPDESWLGRVLDATGNPVDRKGGLCHGKTIYSLCTTPPLAYERSIVKDRMDSGIKAIDCFSPIFYGQRIGIFAGSGVGKSVLLSMIAKYAEADVKIIGLIGERGREVNEFIKKFTSKELSSMIIVVATGDQPAFLRKQAANLVMTLSEYFRDKGKNVICMIDSVTRFAYAQREIGLLSGESASARGYTPSVFVELPKLLERAGPGVGAGSITGIFAVLVDGEDMDEPLSDVLRAILDGHIVLHRKIAEKGRYPAIDVLKSISRIMHQVLEKNELNLIYKLKKVLSIYRDMEEIISMGLYKSGSNTLTDTSIDLNTKIEDFLRQFPDEKVLSEESIAMLKSISETTLKESKV